MTKNEIIKSIIEDIKISPRFIYDEKLRKTVQEFAEMLAELIENKYRDAKKMIEANVVQECYLQCLVIEQGEGECAEAIATKFPELVSRNNSEDDVFINSPEFKAAVKAFEKFQERKEQEVEWSRGGKQ